MHQCIKFVSFWNDTLHVSDGLSVHHQEFKTVHTATGICLTNLTVVIAMCLSNSNKIHVSVKHTITDNNAKFLCFAETCILYLVFFFFDVLLTVHLSLFISVINQLDAQNFCFTISLFHVSTCFEHMCYIIRRSKLHYTASGIITPIGGRLVHRLREDWIPLSTCAPDGHL